MKTSLQKINARLSLGIFSLLLLGVSVILYTSQQDTKVPVQQFQLVLDATEVVDMPEVGIQFSAQQSMGNTEIELFDHSVMLAQQKSITKVVGIHPENNTQLDATLTFQYHESELNGLAEDLLVLYSSQDDGETWQSHANSIVDTENNSIHLSDIEHFSLWTAGPLCAPGGVTVGLAQWARADASIFSDAGTTAANDGDPVIQWNDLSTQLLHLTAAPADAPVVVAGTKETNYNTSLDFAGDYMTNQNRIVPIGSDLTMIAVGITDVLSGVRTLYSFGDNANDPTMDLQSNFISPFCDGSAPSNVDIFTGGQLPIDKPMIWGLRGLNENTIANDLSFFYQGEEISTTMDIANTTQFGIEAHVGGASGGAENWDGRIMEVIAYDTKLSTTDLQKVSSYLAIKYGITLRTVDNDATIIEGDYILSNGTKAWDYTANTAYHNNVAGIVRDDASGLYQKQAIGIEDNSPTSGIDALVTIGIGTGLASQNPDNANTFSNDLASLIWGNNNASASYGTSYIPNSFSPAAGYFHYDRIWKVSETGIIGTVTVGVPRATGAEHLLVHNSADFSTGVPAEIALTDDGNGNLVATVDFNDGDYFTFGNELQAPGGVAGALQLWVKGDSGTSSTADGTAVNTWNDQSGNNNNMTVTAANRDPFYTNAASTSNFNPTVTFDGANDGMEIAPFMTGTEPGGSVFGAAANNSPGTGFDNLVVFGVDNPHLGVAASSGKPLGYCNGSSPIRNDHPTSPVASQFHIWGWEWDMANEPSNTSSNTGLDVVFDGQINTAPTMELRESSFANGAPAANQFQIGSYEAVEVWDGPIGEIAVYSRNLTAAESQKVNSYFSIKWGTTLDDDPANPTTNYDYVSSDGTIIWGGTSDVAYQAYHNNIGGIGEDAASGLNQKQSRSVSAGTIVAIYNGDQSGGLPASNASNTTSFASDKSFLLWGNNGNLPDYATAYIPNTFVPASSYYHMARIWKVAEAGMVGTVTIHGPSGAEHLLVHNGADFSVGTPMEIALADDGNGNLVATVDLADGDFFTFGRERYAPGGVVAGLNLWLRADVGTTPSTTGELTAWEDLAQFNSAGQLGGRPLPSVIDGSASLFNFNKAVEFTATSQKIGNITSTTLGTTNYDIFTFTKEGMTGSRFFNIGRDNTTFNGTNWDSPAFYTANLTVMRRASSGALLYLANPGGTYSTTLPSLTYNQFTDVSTTKGYNGANTGAVASYGTAGSPMGGYIVGANNSTGTGGDDAGFTGTVGEFIAYNRNLSPTERRRVDSYMAIKYGITLDQTTVADYLDSDASVIWNTAANTGYNDDIAGIARDDASALLQKQSKSINPSSVITIYNGDQSGGLPVNNAVNVSTFGADKEFMLWGHNGNNATYTTAYTPNTFLPAAGYFHMGRIWKVQETGTVGIVTIQVSGNADHLLVHNSADFSTGTPTETPLVDDGNGNLIVTVDLTDGQFFTFGKESAAPGGVVSNLVAWYKADGVISDTQWNDESGNGKHMLAAGNGTVARMPTLEVSPGEINNFNPRVAFLSTANGSRKWTMTESGNDIFANTTTPGSVFNVSSFPATTVYDVPQMYAFQDDDPGLNLITDRNAANDIRVIFQRDNGGTGQPGWDFAVAGYPQTEPLLTAHCWNYAAGGNSFTFNGYDYTPSSNPFIGAMSGRYLFGAETLGGGGEAHSGYTSENVVYATDWAPNSNERKRINSYLAIKYGVTLLGSGTLGGGAGAATFEGENDYLSASSTVIWNGTTTNSAYHNYVAGIGRDDASDLIQKQSKSVRNGSIVAIYYGDQSGGLPADNASNSAVFNTDNSFMLWGNNGAAITYTENVGVFDLMARQWKIQETGAVGTVTVSSGDPSAEYLVVDTDGDGDFSTGTLTSIELAGGLTTYDFNDGDYFTFGQVSCIISTTYACSAGDPVNLPSHILSYPVGGTWTESTSSGADISNPASVDFSAIPDGDYVFKYQTAGPECYYVNVKKLSTIPAPVLDDITVCEGADVTINVPLFDIPQEEAFHAAFDGPLTYVARGQCTGGTIGTCPTNNEAIVTAEGLTLTGDFTSLKRASDYILRYAGGLHFMDVNSEFCVETPTISVAPGDLATLSVDLRRSYGYMEPDDYIRVYSIIDGVETLEQEYAGQISAYTQTFRMTGVTGGTVAIKVCVKSGDGQYGIGGYDGPLERFSIEDMKIVITPQLPSYTFYDADPVGAANVLGTGSSYDAGTTPATSPETVWVTCTVNGCESEAEPVVITVSEAIQAMMDGSIAYYCPGGAGADPTLNLEEHIINFQPGGTWEDLETTGVDLSDPSAVDFTGIADGVYQFEYQLDGSAPCDGESALVMVSIGQLADDPIIDDITTCEGGATAIVLPIPMAGVEVPFQTSFDGPPAYVAYGECTATTIGSCPVNNESIISAEGLMLSGDFSTLKRSSDYIRRIGGEIRFHDVNSEFCLETSIQAIGPGDEAAISVDLRRSGGYMEVDDYIRIYSIVDGVETLEQEYTGQISSSMQTFQKTGITGSAIALKVCVKNGDGISGIGGVDGPLEHYAIGGMQIAVTPPLPTYTFYDADPDAGPATALATGYQYDPGTTAGTSPQTIYVKYENNGCESNAVPVTITVSPNPIMDMDGTLAHYCPAGPGANSTIDLTAFVLNYQPGGTWSDDDAAGVSLASPAAVDFAAVGDGLYHFTYILSGVAPCDDKAVTMLVVVGEEAEAIPTLSAATLANVCPIETVDLNSLESSTAPVGSTLVWSTDGDPSDGLSSTVADPTMVAAAGTYYAYYSANGCLADDPAPSVAVTIIDCTLDTDGDGVPDVTDSDPADPCVPAQVAGYTGYDAGNATWAAEDCDGDG
ncbi:MAG: hypothetical protein ACRBG0_08485, partial [Lewinella sp.]